MPDEITVTPYEIVYGLKARPSSDQLETWTCYTAKIFRITPDEKVLLPDVGDDYDILSLDACREACESAGATHWLIFESRVRGIRGGRDIEEIVPCIAETNLPSKG